MEARAVPADRRAAKVVRVEASRVAATREGLADARVDPAVVSGETAPELQLVNKGGSAKKCRPLFLTPGKRAGRCCLHHIQPLPDQLGCNHGSPCKSHPLTSKALCDLTA